MKVNIYFYLIIFYFIVQGNIIYQNQINNSNYLNQLLNIPFDDNNNLLIYNNKNIKQKKKGRPFTERAGDWICSNCKNLNFAFRVVCNRCHLSKSESEKVINDKEKDNLDSNSPKDSFYKYKNEDDSSVNNSMINLNEGNVNTNLK